MERIFESCESLGGAVSGSGGAVDLDGLEKVVFHDEFSAAGGAGVGEGAERHHLAAAVGDVELSQVLRGGAIGTLGLNVDLPLPAETVEVVDQRAAHEGLECLVDAGQADLLGEHLGLVHIDSYLGNSEERGAHDTGKLRALLQRCQESLGIAGQEWGS